MLLPPGDGYCYKLEFFNGGSVSRNNDPTCQNPTFTATFGDFVSASGSTATFDSANAGGLITIIERE